MKKFLPLVVLVLVSCATTNLATVDYQPPEGWTRVVKNAPSEISVLANHQQGVYFKRDDRVLIVEKTVLPRVWYDNLSPQVLSKKVSEYGETTVTPSVICNRFKSDDSFAIETVSRFPYKNETGTRRSIYIVSKRDNGKAEITKLYYVFQGDEVPNEFVSAVRFLE